MKRFFLAAVATLLMTMSAYADSGITVELNSHPVEFTAVQPQIIDGRTLVPLRGLFDAMGYSISWDNNTKTAILVDDDEKIELTTEKMVVTEDDGEKREIISDVKPQLINGYFMLPVRAIAEATGANVTWSQELKTVYVDFSDDDFDDDDDIDKIDKKKQFEGTMSVDEKEYLQGINDCTKSIKQFAVDNNDTLLKVLFGTALDVDSVKAGGDLSYYQPVFTELDKLAALQPPQSMNAVQQEVSSYIGVVREAIEDGVEDSIEGDMLDDLNESSYELSQISENFSVRLYTYFKENKVFFEGIYGEEILDALK